MGCSVLRSGPIKRRHGLLGHCPPTAVEMFAPPVRDPARLLPVSRMSLRAIPVRPASSNAAQNNETSVSDKTRSQDRISFGSTPTHGFRVIPATFLARAGENRRGCSEGLVGDDRCLNAFLCTFNFIARHVRRPQLAQSRNEMFTHERVGLLPRPVLLLRIDVNVAHQRVPDVRCARRSACGSFPYATSTSTFALTCVLPSSQSPIPTCAIMSRVDAFA